MEPDVRPLISVCIPVFNQERFIVPCLDSIAQENYEPIEICVVDDGSTDGSGALVRDWIRRHPKVRARCTEQTHRGLPRTLNRLIAEAHGDFIAWVDHDDVLIPGGLQRRLDYLKGHPRKAAVFGDCRVIDGEGRLLHASAYRGFRWGSRRLFRWERGLRTQLLLNWTLLGSTLLVRRDVYSALGPYDETLIPGHQDYDFALRLLGHRRLGFVNAVVSSYRVHDGNRSLRPADRSQILRGFLRVAKKNARLFGPADRLLLFSFAVAAWVKGTFLNRRDR